MDLLTNIIPTQYAIVSALLSFFMLFAMVKLKVFKTILDPASLVFFQLFFTFFILISLKLLPIGDFFNFLFMILTVIVINRLNIKKIKIFNEDDWIIFVKFFFVISILLNIYLIFSKGLLLFSSDMGNARVEFYQDYGLFKRFNEIGMYLFGLTGFYLYYFNKKKGQQFFLFTPRFLFYLWAEHRH